MLREEKYILRAGVIFPPEAIFFSSPPSPD
jgi:hypothetical protein